MMPFPDARKMVLFHASRYPRRGWVAHAGQVLLLLVMALGGLSGARAAEEVTADYRLGPGDQIKISVLHEDNLGMEVRLSDKGSISYPLIGEIQAAGKTTHEVEALIRNALDGKYLVDPQVSVNVMEFRKFFVGGAVNQPGGFPYAPGITVQQAIAIAGGQTEKAADEVRITHERDPARTPQPARLQDPIQPGDHIEVKEAGEIVVEGEVKQPGVYPYTRGMTVHKAIALAGGQTERASRTIILIHEDDPEHKPEEVGPFTPVKPGDLIHVEESFF